VEGDEAVAELVSDHFRKGELRACRHRGEWRLVVIVDAGLTPLAPKVRFLCPRNGLEEISFRCRGSDLQDGLGALFVALRNEDLSHIASGALRRGRDGLEVKQEGK